MNNQYSEVFNHYSNQCEKHKQALTGWECNAQDAPLVSIQAAAAYDCTKLEDEIQYFTNLKYWFHGFGDMLGKAVLLREWECSNTENTVLKHIAKAGCPTSSLLSFAFLYFNESKKQYVIADFFNPVCDELLSGKVWIWTKSENGVWWREPTHAAIEDILQKCVAYMNIPTGEIHLIDERIDDWHDENSDEMRASFTNDFLTWQSEFASSLKIQTPLVQRQGSLFAKDLFKEFESLREHDFVFNSPEILNKTIFGYIVEVWQGADSKHFQEADYLLVAKFGVQAFEKRITNILDNLRRVRHFTNTAKIMFDFYNAIKPNTTIFALAGVDAAKYHLSHFIWRNGWIAVFKEENGGLSEVRAEKIKKNVQAYNPN